MTSGRLLGGRVVDRYGRSVTVRWSAALAVAGILTVILAGNLILAALGRALWVSLSPLAVRSQCPGRPNRTRAPHVVLAGAVLAGLAARAAGQTRATEESSLASVR